MKKIFQKKFTYEIIAILRYHIDLVHVKDYTDQITDVAPEDYFADDEKALEAYRHMCDKSGDDMDGMINLWVDDEIQDTANTANFLLNESDSTMHVEVKLLYYLDSNDKYVEMENIKVYPDTRFAEWVPNQQRIYDWADEGLTRSRIKMDYSKIAVDICIDDTIAYREILKITNRK